MEIGCIIDGSHIRTQDFQIEVIRFAVDVGFEIDIVQFDKDVEWLNEPHSIDELDEDQTLLDILDALDWTYEDALSYLNDNVREGYCWSVEDQSLYLEEVND